MKEFYKNFLFLSDNNENFSQFKILQPDRVDKY